MKWVQLYGSLNILWHCLLVTGMKTDLLQSCGHCLVFLICWHIECSTAALNRLLRPFLYSSVYSCHLFLISSASVRFLPFLSFIVPIFAWNVLLLSVIFLKRSPLFPILWFSYISFHCSFKKLSYLSLLFSGALHSVGYVFPFLLCLLPLFFSQLFIRPPQTTILPSCIAFLGGWSHNQQKQDQELTVAQIMNSLLLNSDLNRRK